MKETLREHLLRLIGDKAQSHTDYDLGNYVAFMVERIKELELEVGLLDRSLKLVIEREEKLGVRLEAVEEGLKPLLPMLDHKESLTEGEIVTLYIIINALLDDPENLDACLADWYNDLNQD